jgi:hypothetical protein
MQGSGGVLVQVRVNEMRVRHNLLCPYVSSRRFLQKGEVKCEGQPTGWNWERVHW